MGDTPPSGWRRAAVLIARPVWTRLKSLSLTSFVTNLGWKSRENRKNRWRALRGDQAMVGSRTILEFGDCNSAQTTFSSPPPSSLGLQQHRPLSMPPGSTARSDAGDDQGPIVLGHPMKRSLLGPGLSWRFPEQTTRRRWTKGPTRPILPPQWQKHKGEKE